MRGWGAGEGARLLKRLQRGKGGSQRGWGCTHLRLPLQPAVPRVVRRQGPLCHRSMPEVVIVAEDLRQSREAEPGFPSVSPRGGSGRGWTTGCKGRLTTPGGGGASAPGLGPARGCRGQRGTHPPWHSLVSQTTYVGSQKAGRTPAPIPTHPYPQLPRMCPDPDGPDKVSPQSWAWGPNPCPRRPHRQQGPEPRPEVVRPGRRTYLAQVEEAVLARQAVSHSRASGNVHGPGVGVDLLGAGVGGQQDQGSCRCYHP